VRTDQTACKTVGHPVRRSRSKISHPLAAQPPREECQTLTPNIHVRTGRSFPHRLPSNGIVQ
jgi:hypothetical protein